MGVRVVPRAARAAVGGHRGGRLVIRVTAPPVDGRANEAVLAALADALRLPRREVLLVRGERSRDKDVSVPAAARARLEMLAAGPAYEG